MVSLSRFVLRQAVHLRRGSPDRRCQRKTCTEIFQRGNRFKTFCASVVIAFGCGVSSHAYAWCANARRDRATGATVPGRSDPAFNDNGVGGRNVDPGFDNGGQTSTLKR